MLKEELLKMDKLKIELNKELSKIKQELLVVKQKNKLIEELNLVKQNKAKMIKDELNRIKQSEMNANSIKQENALLKEELLKMDKLKIELNKELTQVRQKKLQITVGWGFAIFFRHYIFFNLYRFPIGKSESPNL